MLYSTLHFVSRSSITTSCCQDPKHRSSPQHSRRRALQLLVSSSLPLAVLPSHSQPIDSSQQVAADYDSYAGSYDSLDGSIAAKVLGLQRLRRQALAQAGGDVLELGVGTGLNLPFYNPQRLTSLTAIDLSAGMLAQAEEKLRALPSLGQVTLVQGDASRLPFPDASYDCVTDTYSLCVFPDPSRALSEAARVLRPGGRLIAVEHARSTFTPLALYQDVTAGAVASGGKGCVWNQDVPKLLDDAGFRILRSSRAIGGLIVAITAEKPN